MAKDSKTDKVVKPAAITKPALDADLHEVILPYVKAETAEVKDLMGKENIRHGEAMAVLRKREEELTPYRDRIKADGTNSIRSQMLNLARKLYEDTGVYIDVQGTMKKSKAKSGKGEKESTGEKQTRRRITNERKDEVPGLIKSAIKSGIVTFNGICETMDDVPESVVRYWLQALIIEKQLKKNGDKKNTTYSFARAKAEPAKE